MFWVYAAFLFTATHWPALKIEGPVERTDLWGHLGAFCLWAVLACAAGLFRPALTPRSVLLTGLLASAYAGLDEGLQAIPVLQRTAAWDDLGADLLGVWAGCGVMLVVGLLRRRA